MSEARSGRFSLVSGPFGWAATALTIAAIVCQLVSVLVLVWLAFNNDSNPPAIWIGVLVVSFPLGAGAVALWRIQWTRAGAARSILLPTERLKEVIQSSALAYLGSALGIGGFLYLAFTLEGNRRLALALSAFFLGTAISELGTMRLYEILPVRRPFRFGRSRWWSWAFVAVSVVLSGLLLVLGLVWPDLIPMP